MLIVEDDPGVRHVIATLLTRRGHNVISASSAPEAMALVLDFLQPLDMAVLDVVLPGTTGVECGVALKAMFPSIRLIFMTGWYDHPKLADAPVADEVLMKPFSSSDLFALGL